MKSHEQILAELDRAVHGLWYMSESDYPLEAVLLEGTGEPDPDRLRELAAAPAAARVETRELEEFFRDAAAVRITGAGTTKTAGPASFADVLRILKENLADIRVYRIGAINIPVFVLGRSDSGTWLGVRTRVVET